MVRVGKIAESSCLAEKDGWKRVLWDWGFGFGLGLYKSARDCSEYDFLDLQQHYQILLF